MFVWKGLCFTFIFWWIFSVYVEFQVWDIFFFLDYFKDVSSFFLVCSIFHDKLVVFFFFFDPFCAYVVSSGCFWDFLFVTGFLPFDYECTLSFFFSYLSSLLSFLDMWIYSFSNLEIIYHFFKYFSSPPSHFLYMYVIVTQVTEALFIFSVFFSFISDSFCCFIFPFSDLFFCSV